MSSTTTTPSLFENLGHALSTDYFFLREQLTEDELEVLRRCGASSTTRCCR
jgi:hypothetical protein